MLGFKPQKWWRFNKKVTCFVGQTNADRGRAFEWICEVQPLQYLFRPRLSVNPCSPFFLPLGPIVLSKRLQDNNSDMIIPFLGPGKAVFDYRYGQVYGALFPHPGIHFSVWVLK